MVQASACFLEPVGVMLGLQWGYMGITEKKMETTIMGYIEFRVCGCGYSVHDKETLPFTIHSCSGCFIYNEQPSLGRAGAAGHFACQGMGFRLRGSLRA